MGDMTGHVSLVTGGIRGAAIAAGYSHDKEAADKFRADHPAPAHQGNIG